MDTFNIRTFLVENNLTTSSRIISEEDKVLEKYYKCSSAEEILREVETELKKARSQTELEIVRNIIDGYEGKISSLEEDSNLEGFINSSKLKEMKRTLNNLKKYEQKCMKEYEKRYSPKKKK